MTAPRGMRPGPAAAAAAAARNRPLPNAQARDNRFPTVPATVPSRGVIAVPALRAPAASQRAGAPAAVTKNFPASHAPGVARLDGAAVGRANRPAALDATQFHRKR